MFQTTETKRAGMRRELLIQLLSSPVTPRIPINPENWFVPWQGYKMTEGGGDGESTCKRGRKKWRMGRERSMVRGRKKDEESEMLVFAYWQAPISCRDLQIEGIQCFVAIEGRLDLCSAAGLKLAEWLCWSAITHVRRVVDKKVCACVWVRVHTCMCVTIVARISSAQFVKHEVPESSKTTGRENVPECIDTLTLETLHVKQ